MNVVNGRPGVRANPNGNKQRRWPGAVAIVLLLALAVRLAYVIQLGGSVLFRHPQGDALLHYQVAQAIAAGDWLGHDIFYFAPLYPYLVALVFRCVGVRVAAVVLVQVLLGTLDAAVIAVVGRRLFGARVGVAAGLVAALYGPFVFYTGFLLKETLGLLLLDLFLLAAILVVERGDWGAGWLPGLFLGLGCLVRPNLLPLSVAVAVWWCVAWPVRAWGRRAAAVALFLAGVAALILPVAVRNHTVGGEWVWISAHGGHNFFIGNRYGASGLYQPLEMGGGQTPLDEERDARRIAERAEGRPLTAAGVSAYWYARGWRAIREHPGNFLRVTLRKLALFGNRYEVPDNVDIYFVRHEVPALWLAPIGFGIVTPLALCGLVLRLDRWRRCVPIYLMIAATVASVVPFFVFARYRIPAVPSLIVLAAAGIVALADELRARNAAAFARGGGVLLATALFVNWPIYTPADFLATSYFNAGNLYQAEGRADEALAAWREAVRLNEGYAKAQRVLGEACFQAGRFADAAEALRHAVLQSDGSIAGDRAGVTMLGVSLMKSGRPEAAARVLRAGLERWPADASLARALDELRQPPQQGEAP
jgi:4-amino-4-deoxy-L-arabinose transferase-like glycosyltransferase